MDAILGVLDEVSTGITTPDDVAFVDVPILPRSGTDCVDVAAVEVAFDEVVSVEVALVVLPISVGVVVETGSVVVALNGGITKVDVAFVEVAFESLKLNVCVLVLVGLVDDAVVVVIVVVPIAFVLVDVTVT